MPPIPATRIAYSAGSASRAPASNGSMPFRTRTPTPSAPKPSPDRRPAQDRGAGAEEAYGHRAPGHQDERDGEEPPVRCTSPCGRCPHGPPPRRAGPARSRPPPIDVHSARLSRMPSSLTLSTAVMTRLALITVWDRKSGSRRAASAPSPNPTKSRMVPTMNSHVVAAFAVEERLGPAVLGPVARGLRSRPGGRGGIRRLAGPNPCRNRPRRRWRSADRAARVTPFLAGATRSPHSALPDVYRPLGVA